MNIEEVATGFADWVEQYRTTAVLVAGVAVIALFALGWWIRRQRGRNLLGRFFDTAAVLVAVALSAEGMWEAATEQLHLGPGAALLLFAFAELAMLRAARRARAKVDKIQRPGVYGLMVWGIALSAGLIATSNAPNVTEHLIRFGAPLLVAAQWWADLVDELREKLGTTERQSSAWIWTPQRLGVQLGLLRPGNADDLDEVYRSRRVAKMVRLAGRIDTGKGRLSGRRKRRLRRLAEVADAAMMAEVRERYLRGAEAETRILGAPAAHPNRAAVAQPDTAQQVRHDLTPAHPLRALPETPAQHQVPQVARPSARVDAPAPRRGQVVMRRPAEAPEDERGAALARAAARVLAQGEAVRGAARAEGVAESTLRTRLKQAETNGHDFRTAAV